MSYSVLVFSHSITPRLQYVVDFLSEYYGLGFKLTSAEEKYIDSSDPCKINYSYHKLAAGELFIHSHVLLTESYIRPVKIECFEKNGYKAFFKTEGDLGFDLFAGIFYLLTRYEEYLPHKTDMHGRYPHELSVASREDFLHLPLINIWLEDFRVLLAQKDPAFLQPAKQFSFLPTYDIDMAWSFLHKGFKRNAGAIAKLLLQGKFSRLAQRIRVLRHKRKDPFDAYEWMDALHRQYGLHPIYFFLVAKEKSRYDKNIDVANPDFIQLVQSIAQGNETGLHPSWHSHDVPALVAREKATLEKMSGRTITASRQHYIRMQLPATYQRLIAARILHDHSMGYATINGFRASVATPYFWYDLKNEQKTKLRIYPFCFMDANAFYEQKLSPQAAFEELMQYLQTVKKVHGTMITLWHNNFLGTDDAFEGWKEIYAAFVKEAGRQATA